MDESAVHLPSPPPAPSIQVRGRKWRENENGMETFSFPKLEMVYLGPLLWQSPSPWLGAAWAPQCPPPRGWNRLPGAPSPQSADPQQTPGSLLPRPAWDLRTCEGISCQL